MLAVVEGILAELRSAPAVDRNVEISAGLQGGYEASHGRKAKGSSIVREGIAGNDMTVDLEFFQGDPRIAAGGEEKHIPIFVAHGEREKRKT